MKKTNPGIAIKLYRKSNWCYKHNLKFLANILSRIIYLMCNCVIYPTIKIGKGTQIPHSVGIVLHQHSEIGENCVIYQNVTIGNGNGPRIGSNCIIGTGAVILGDIKIGNNVNIGANAVVLMDIPDNCTVVGIPGRIVKK